MILPNIWKNKNFHVPNHQSVAVIVKATTSTKLGCRTSLAKDGQWDDDGQCSIPIQWQTVSLFELLLGDIHTLLPILQWRPGVPAARGVWCCVSWSIIYQQKNRKVKRLKLDMKWHSKMKTHLNFNHWLIISQKICWVSRALQKLLSIQFTCGWSTELRGLVNVTQYNNQLVGRI